MAKILLAEDDEAVARSVAECLAEEKHRVETFFNGQDAADMLQASEYDLLVLDYEMPGLTGPQICKSFRDRGGTTPVLMLTGRSTLDDKEAGLDAGADDYLTKPFEPRELKARVRALLRRQPVLISEKLSCGSLSLDCKTNTLSYGGTEKQLQPRESDLLAFFMRHPGESFSVETILKRIWQGDADVNDEVVYTYMTKLRKKLSVEGKECPLKTSRGMGYRLVVTDLE